ncbi:unnamed protein product, partial [Darwinula stevensoni]
MKMPKIFIGKVVEDYRKRALHFAFTFKDVLYKLLVVLLTTTVLIWLSVFLYGVFYYLYMPAVAHTRPVHFIFEPCKEEAGLCSFPSANVTLAQRFKDHLLMRGQQYHVLLDLDMPESPMNQQLGMFMVKIDLKDYDGNVRKSGTRAAMLRYRSFLHQLVYTLAFAPVLLTGTFEEKQLVTVELLSLFEDDPNDPVTHAIIEVQSRHVQIYGAQLRVHAHFTGLRYLMFHFPVLSAVIGIATNLFFLILVASFSWYHWVFLPYHENVVRVGFDDATYKSLEARRAELKERMEKQKHMKVDSRLRSRSLSYDSLPVIEEYDTGKERHKIENLSSLPSSNESLHQPRKITRVSTKEALSILKDSSPGTPSFGSEEEREG